MQGNALDYLKAQAENSVDRVFSLDFLEHVEPSDAIQFTSEVRRVLKPGGIFIARTPSCDGPFGAAHRYNDITHKWGMTSGSAIQLMELSGFVSSSCSILDEAPVPYKISNVLRRVLFKLLTRSMGFILDISGIAAPRVWTRSMWIIARAI